MFATDYRYKLRHLYNPPADGVQVVDVPRMQFLAVDGKGHPAVSEEFQKALSALYAVSFTINRLIRYWMPEKRFRLTPLEILWWPVDQSADDRPQDYSRWTLLNMQPDFVTRELFCQAFDDFCKGKKTDPSSQIRFESFSEGKAAQIMHTGAFADDKPYFAKLHDCIIESGGTPSGKHHQIYLNNWKTSNPEKWKTVLRQPMICDAIPGETACEKRVAEMILN